MLVRTKDRGRSRPRELVGFGGGLVHHLGDDLATVAFFLCNLVDTLVLHMVGSPDAFIHTLIEHGSFPHHRCNGHTPCRVLSHRLVCQNVMSQTAFAMILPQRTTIFKDRQAVSTCCSWKW